MPLLMPVLVRAHSYVDGQDCCQNGLEMVKAAIPRVH